MKILCTMKSIKQQIYYFYYALYSTQSLQKKLSYACVIQFLLSIKNNKNQPYLALELDINNFSKNMYDTYFS
jgi:hypothetical protein